MQVNSKNSLEIEISKEEFLKKSIEEQNWLLFQALCHINKNGCSWRKKQWKKVYIIGSVMGLIGGFIASLGRFFK